MYTTISGSSGIENTMQQSEVKSRLAPPGLPTEKLIAKRVASVLNTLRMSLVTTSQDEFKLAWLDLLWIVFLGALAVLPPFYEPHKELALLGIGTFQIFDRR